MNHGAREGAYWGIWTDIAEYGLVDTLPGDLVQSTRLAQTPTRLAKLDDLHQQRLINWGYAVCDAAVRSFVDRSLPAPADVPYPQAGTG